MRKLRVWVVSPEVHRTGGTERSLAEFLERWRDRFDLRLYTMHTQGVDLEGIRVIRLQRLPGPHLLRYLVWFASNTLARRWHGRGGATPDIVHSAGVNCRDADAISVHMVFAKYWEDAGRRTLRDLRDPRRLPRALHRVLWWNLVRALEHGAYRGPASIWAVGPVDAPALESRFGRPPGSVPVITHGVDATQFRPEARDARRTAARNRLGVDGNRVVLLVGNDTYKKGVDVAIRSLRLLPEDVGLAIAGTVERDQVMGWAIDAGVKARVWLWPHTEDILEYYSAADVLAAPSREDAFAQPPLEALACGLPVVVSARAGVAGLLEDRRHALVIEDPEDPPALAGLLRVALEDRSLTERLAIEGRRLAELNSWDAAAEKAAGLIEREASTPRVVVLAPGGWGPGGIQRSVRTLARALADTVGPERIALASIWSGEGDLPCRVAVPGLSERPGGRVPVWFQVRYALSSLLLARRWRQRLRVIACHPSLAPVALACRVVSGAPYAVWCHGYETWGRLQWTVGVALRRADVVFAPSAFSARATEMAAGLAAGSVRVVPHGLPPDLARDFARSSEETPPTVLTVARLEPEHAYKGVDVLIRAWPKVQERVPGAALVVAGDGRDRPRLETLARSLAADGTVHFAGRVSDRELAQLYGSATVFALPSRAHVGSRAEGEGFGLVLIEAAAAGLPVIAGRAGPAPEVIRDGETGMLVDPQDPEQLASAISDLLLDRGRARRMGEAGVRWVESGFRYEAFRTRVEKVLDELTGSRQDLRRDVGPRPQADIANKVDAEERRDGIV